MSRVTPGPRNSLTDVAGLSVGNAEDTAVRTGVTVVLCDRGVRATAAVDVRGGGPGTRETDALAGDKLVRSADAVVLSGGSAFGLDAAGAVQVWLADQGRGFDTGGGIVPIVPAAILYDLANRGEKAWGLEPPYRGLGFAAARAAGPGMRLGKAGAGYGAMAGSVEGGLGTASAVDPLTGAVVGALVAVNCFGETIQRDGRFFAAPFEQDGEFGGLGPSPERADPTPGFPKLDPDTAIRGPRNTTIAVVATDAALGHADTQRMAVMAQAGMARAIRPVFTPFDGDTVFALATGKSPTPDLTGAARIGAIAADCLARAIARAVFEAAPLAPDRPAWRTLFARTRFWG